MTDDITAALWKVRDALASARKPDKDALDALITIQRELTRLSESEAQSHD